MLKTFDEASRWIEEGKVLHVAGNEGLLRKLPKGNWIGGSTEYFMADEGGLVSDSQLFVTEFPKGAFTICDYGADTVKQIAADAYDNGFSVIIIPFDSEVHKEYARGAADYAGMFIKHVVGWIAGVNLNTSGQVPIAVNGQTGAVLTNGAAVLHLEVPESKTVNIGIVNIHKQDEHSPVIEFDQHGSTTVTTCRVNGKEVLFADYLNQIGYDTRIPMVADYFGHGVNVSFRSVEGGAVQLYAPVFGGIKYRFATAVPDYTGAFQQQIDRLKDADAIFSCNCILNFLFGELNGKKIGAFNGPITFGEVAYQLLNQTLVYVTVS